MITILSVGTTKDKNIHALIQEYLKRLSLQKIIIKSIKEEKAKNPEEIKQKEGKRILETLQGINNNPYIIALSEEGKLMNSIAFADFLKKNTDKNIIFIVGGVFGFSAEAKTRADMLLSLSPLTFPHEIAQLLMIEQIYRAWTIRTGRQYHK